MKTGAIIQARAASTRLPCKVLKELPYGSGITALEQVLRRLKKSALIGEMIVATTENKKDEGIIKIAEKEGVGFFRGSEKDVLSRYYHAAREASLDTVVRITSDCPCIDPAVVDSVIGRHIAGGPDYTSNTLRRTYPHGMDVEVFRFDVLRRAFEEAREDPEREHVTPYIYRSGKFKTQNIEAPPPLRRPDIRVTLDTKEDYALLCIVYDCLYESNPYFGMKEVVDLFGGKPWLLRINENVTQKKIFDSLADELREAVKILDLQDLKRARDFIKKRLKEL